MFGILDFSKPIVDFSNFEFSQLGDALIFAFNAEICQQLFVFLLHKYLFCAVDPASAKPQGVRGEKDVFCRQRAVVEIGVAFFCENNKHAGSAVKGIGGRAHHGGVCTRKRISHLSFRHNKHDRCLEVAAAWRADAGLGDQRKRFLIRHIGLKAFAAAPREHIFNSRCHFSSPINRNFLARCTLFQDCRGRMPDYKWCIARSRRPRICGERCHPPWRKCNW